MGSKEPTAHRAFLAATQEPVLSGVSAGDRQLGWMCQAQHWDTAWGSLGGLGGLLGEHVMAKKKRKLGLMASLGSDMHDKANCV